MLLSFATAERSLEAKDVEDEDKYPFFVEVGMESRQKWQSSLDICYSLLTCFLRHKIPYHRQKAADAVSTKRIRLLLRHH